MARADKGLLADIVRPFDSFFAFVGEITILLVDALKRIFTSRFEFRETLSQMAFVGVNSVPIVALTGFFSGAVLSLYISTFLLKYGATTFVGATVALSMTREIGPVLAGIMVSARCGSAMAAQIGTMAVTEQIDALKMLSVHPTNYLVVPRVVASILMLPILGLTCMWAGSFGGWLVATNEGVPSGEYLTSINQFTHTSDLLGGLYKTPVFGLIVALVACQQGMRTKNGAVGVGRATTNTVVISMVLVYVTNFLLARLMN
ncbi:MAG: ABC transporter permease [Armatimonadetes bacterium]|nr:MlaE family lipid ABC transporter permease subunit [Armatimonadota bacterium]MBS1703943.1 ABC transporter permease [Armatimonadota bacterium]MBS1728008.1 ABC transporter permease [Armatimonadota bacterium]